MSFKLPTETEITELNEWLKTNPNIPKNILGILKTVMNVYGFFLRKESVALGTLHMLREKMGFLPKSEKTTQLNFEQPLLSPELAVEIAKLKEEKASTIGQTIGISNKLRKLIPEASDKNQLKFLFEFEQAEESLFSWPTSERQDKDITQKVDRMENFNTAKGLRSTYDYVKRINLAVVVTQTTYQVETVENTYDGKRVRAPMTDIGPENSQYTWQAIGNLIKMHVGFVIPMNRIEMMIGQPEFTSTSMCRIFEFVATALIPIYLILFKQLALADVLWGDDTNTKILELISIIKEKSTEDSANSKKEAPQSINDQIDKALGWESQRADGKGAKKALSVSLLIGKSKKEDRRSTIRFFRTHGGNLGNLLSQLLKNRPTEKKDLTFQGDLSPANLPEANWRKIFNIIVAGCGAHSRRPFWRYRKQDPWLCTFMLRGFKLLSIVEQLIDAKGRTRENILKYRGRYGRMIWKAIHNRCVASLTGKVTSRYKVRGGAPKRWPSGMPLHIGCNYIVNHFTELTRYLDNPYLLYTNNGSERALRVEKCMLNTSKFRKNRKGRAILDVLRTINATCTAAEIDITEYLKYFFAHRDEFSANLENLTPYAVALLLEKQKKASEAAAAAK